MARGRGKHTPQDLKYMKIISTNINNLLTSKNAKQVDLSRATGIPQSTLTGYVKGTSLPIPGNVQKIADFFNVKKTDIDPRFIANVSEPSSPTTLTEITNTSAKLDEPRQQIVLATAQKQLAEQNKILKFPDNDTVHETLEPYKQGVEIYSKLAAGVGYSYGADTTTETMYTDRTDLKAYDYATLVSGDSMEPKFHDGDVVLIQQGYDNVNGGIYAVDYDGKSFLKRVYVENGSFVMKSINKKYKDITVPLPIPEGTYLNIIGKVVDSFTPIGK